MASAVACQIITLPRAQLVCMWLKPGVHVWMSPSLYLGFPESITLASFVLEGFQYLP